MYFLKGRATLDSIVVDKRYHPPATMIQRCVTLATVLLVGYFCLVLEHQWYVDQLARQLCFVSHFLGVVKNITFIETLFNYFFAIIALYVPVLEFEADLKTHAWYTYTVWRFGRFLFPFVCGIFMHELSTFGSSVAYVMRSEHEANSVMSNGKNCSNSSLKFETSCAVDHQLTQLSGSSHLCVYSHDA